MPNQIHIPVLKQQLIDILNIKPNGIYVDCTAGFGGHSQLIAQKLNSQGKLICIDQDINAINHLKKLFNSYSNVLIVKDNFKNLDEILKDKKVDGIILDIGVSSLMFDDKSRGFSYHENGKLDMRMDLNQELTAYQVINKYSQDQLVKMFEEYGEINDSWNVVQAIIKQRMIKPIETTLELVDIIKQNIKKSQLFEKKHPARLYFQALRIEVNDELNVLKKVLVESLKHLNKHARLAIITFHSLEDRIVKQIFSKLTSSKDKYEKNIPLYEINQPQYKLLTKKAITANDQELIDNHRSRSAKLRAIEKIS